MNLPFYIARRYLFAKKSHNVINIISAISAIGMAIGTAALIIILSVFNGFESLVKTSMGNVEPDILVIPSTGKAFIPDGEGYDWLKNDNRIESITNVIQENVYVSYDGHNTLAKAKGVEAIYPKISPIKDHIIDGSFQLNLGDIPMAIVGAGLSYSMNISPRFLYPLEIYFPSRTKNISLTNPISSIEKIEVYPSGIFSINGTPDKDLIILQIDMMRELLDYDEEVSAIEIRLKNNNSEKEINKFIKEISAHLGKDVIVQNRFQQNPSLYKMMKYEKASVYFILLFVIIIIAFNIFGSLAMLIIEKNKDINILRSMGANKSLIKKIFILEGWLISIIGLIGGLILGLGFCVLQQKFGFIKMPASFLLQPYPIILKLKDILICSLSILTVGYFIALLPVRAYIKKENI